VNVLLRCGCGAALVIDEGRALRFDMREFRLIKKDQAFSGRCLSCNQKHLLVPFGNARPLTASELCAMI